MRRMKLTFGPPDVTVERRADGAMIVRSPNPLPSHPDAMTDWLDHWAKDAPTRVFLAERQGERHWRMVTYADARDIRPAASRKRSSTENSPSSGRSPFSPATASTMR